MEEQDNNPGGLWGAAATLAAAAAVESGCWGRAEISLALESNQAEAAEMTSTVGLR